MLPCCFFMHTPDLLSGKCKWLFIGQYYSLPFINCPGFMIDTIIYILAVVSVVERWVIEALTWILLCEVLYRSFLNNEIFKLYNEFCHVIAEVRFCMVTPLLVCFTVPYIHFVSGNSSHMKPCHPSCVHTCFWDTRRFGLHDYFCLTDSQDFQILQWTILPFAHTNWYWTLASNVESGLKVSTWRVQNCI